MKGGHDYAAQSNPRRNSRFNRTWGDDPLALHDFQHLDRELTPKVVEDVGRRAIGRWLDQAAQTHGAAATKAFNEADAIRRKMGLAWEELIGQRAAA